RFGSEGDPEESAGARSADVGGAGAVHRLEDRRRARLRPSRSEEHTSELQSLAYLVCRLLLEKKKKNVKVASAVSVPSNGTLPNNKPRKIKTFTVRDENAQVLDTLVAVKSHPAGNAAHRKKAA